MRHDDQATGTTYRAFFGTRPAVWQVEELALDPFQTTWRGRLLDRPPFRADQIGGLGILLADGRGGAFSVAVDWVKLASSTAQS